MQEPYEQVKYMYNAVNQAFMQGAQDEYDYKST